MPRDQQMTLTLTDSCVLGVLNQADRTAAMQGIMPSDREPRLVCLDRRSGREIWSMTARNIPEGAGQFTDLQIGGTPLVVGDNVYLVGRGGRGTQFEDAYVLCFDLSDGHFKWSCYVASANNPMVMYGNGAAVASDFSSLAYASGRLYVVTNLGAVAAIDAYSGSVVWLNIYREGNEASDYPQQIPQQQPPPGRPWTYNPAVVKDGKLFALPSDGKYLLIYDAASGLALKKVNCDDYSDPDLAINGGVSQIDTLMGVWRDKLIVTSNNRVCCIDWKHYDHDAGNYAIAWAATLLRGGG
jgi:outer membrane protein assembly factor BamB